jgi:hypothetical protein
MTVSPGRNGTDYLSADWRVTTYGGSKEPPRMKSKLLVYDAEPLTFSKEDEDYNEKLVAWSHETMAAEKAHWDALCEVLYAAHYKMMESCGGYAVDHTAVDRLDGAIEMILEAMPDRAKAHFDALMLRPCER